MAGCLTCRGLSVGAKPEEAPVILAHRLSLQRSAGMLCRTHPLAMVRADAAGRGDIHPTPPGVYMNTNMQEWREETAAIVNELLADGSNPDLDYEIEHHFACQKFDLLEKAAVDLFKAGFEVTDAEEMELDDGATIFCFDAMVECKLDIDTIVADIEKMLPILKKYGVDYDGWGTYFQE